MPEEAEAPFCLCLAGPNGSGKSTITKGLRQLHALNNWIDPDVVANEIRAAQPSVSEEQISAIAFGIARNRRVEFAQNLADFGFETVFSHPSNSDFLDTLKQVGYTVHLYFVCTDDPLINVGRVRNRHHLGGHDVPEDRIIARYFRALDGLRQCLRRFDRVVLVDNSAALTPGRAIGELRTSSGQTTSMELYPRPHLPDWVIDTVRGFQRSALGPIMQTERPYWRNETDRRLLFSQFLTP